MFNLEQAISHWRRQMLAAGIQNPAPLDELENHLREDIGALVSTGQPEAQAFQLAVARLGNPSSVRTEFKKLRSDSDRSLTIVTCLCLGVALVMACVFACGKWMGFIFYAHCVSLSVGYFAAYVAGGFGICYAWRRQFDSVPPGLQQAFGRAVFRFSKLSAALAVVGLLLGMLWSRQHLGGYWAGGWPEIGGLCGAIWLTSLWLAQQFGQVGPRASLLLSLVSNIVVSLAWFGAGIIAANPRISGHDIARFWPLGAFLGIQLCFLAMGMAPAREPAES